MTPAHLRRRHPLHYWRYHLASDYDGGTLRRMRGHLAKLDFPAEERWRDAATGDAAAAIGIAFGLRSARVPRPDFDAAMTALAVCAARGSDAARAVIARVLRSLPDRCDADDRVADSWVVTPSFNRLCTCIKDPRL
jgi:hypothetical protein